MIFFSWPTRWLIFFPGQPAGHFFFLAGGISYSIPNVKTSQQTFDRILLWIVWSVGRVQKILGGTPIIFRLMKIFWPFLVAKDFWCQRIFDTKNSGQRSNKSLDTKTLQPLKVFIHLPILGNDDKGLHHAVRILLGTPVGGLKWFSPIYPLSIEEGKVYFIFRLCYVCLLVSICLRIPDKDKPHMCAPCVTTRHVYFKWDVLHEKVPNILSRSFGMTPTF